jgi:hypothetical protein
MSDPLNNWLGRRGTIFLTALCLVATPIASGFAKSWEGLFAARLVLGLGMGCKGSTVPVFAAENSPTSIRGALVMSWQLWTVSKSKPENEMSSDHDTGIWYLYRLYRQLGGHRYWSNRMEVASRFCLYSRCAPRSRRLLLPRTYERKRGIASSDLATTTSQESPRWLMKKNRYPQAYRSLLRLRFTPLQAARDLYYIHAQLEAESLIMRGETYLGRFKELFVIPRVRRATLASFTVMIAQQMCGKS